MHSPGCRSFVAMKAARGKGQWHSQQHRRIVARRFGVTSVLHVCYSRCDDLSWPTHMPQGTRSAWHMSRQMVLLPSLPHKSNEYHQGASSYASTSLASPIRAHRAYRCFETPEVRLWNLALRATLINSKPGHPCSYDLQKLSRRAH